MGRHRNDQHLRGVSKGPVIAAVTVVLLVLGVFGWFQLKDRTENQGTAAAGICVEGDAQLVVAADPGIAPAVRELAADFTDTRPVIRDHCISVSVYDADTAAVTDTLTAAPDGPWNDALGSAPALWIPASSQSTGRLSGTGAIDGRPKPVASSPVVLAVPETLADALEAADSGWQDLPALQSAPDALDALGLDGWGGLKLTLPDGADSAATLLALDGVAAAVADAGTGPLDETQAASGPVTSAIAALATGTAPAGTAETITTLTDDPTAPRHAVPATEQQVYASDAAGIVAFAPAGATPVADHPAAVLTTPWVDETLGRAAAQFADYLRRPEQAQTLLDAGFRVGDRTPTATDRTPMPTLGPVLAPATGPAATRIAETLSNPTVPQTTTVLLDVSGSMGYDDITGTRLGNTVNALAARFAALPDSSEVGLWVYSRGLDGNRPYQVKVPTGPLSQDERRQRLETALRTLSPATATSTYASLIAARASAVDDFTPGRTNSILLITDGPDDDTSTTVAQLNQALTGAAQPVRVDVISIGPNTDQSTLQAIAEQTGGTFVALPTTRGDDLPAALTELLA